jgi:hypothetical protein
MTMLDAIQQSRKYKINKRTTDPFQVFCADKRQEITFLYPGDSVSLITSRLASIWRRMSANEKINYAELAKRFDLSLIHQKPQTGNAHHSKTDLSSITLPLITVLQRNGCSSAPHEASLTFLDRVVKAKLTRKLET